MARLIWQERIQISLISIGVGRVPAGLSTRQMAFHRGLPKRAAEPKPGKVIDLMDALKRSRAALRPGHPVALAESKSRRRKAA